MKIKHLSKIMFILFGGRWGSKRNTNIDINKIVFKLWVITYLMLGEEKESGCNKVMSIWIVLRLEQNKECLYY